MPDLLVRLYALPDPQRHYDGAAAAGITVRRAEAWDRFALRRFVTAEFSETWASESDFAFGQGHPIRAFVAMSEGAICGFAAYECTRRGYFGPTGVRTNLRGNGVGAALLFRCLESMREMSYSYAIIGGAGPADFYAAVCGATVINGSDPGVYADLYREAEALRSPRATP